MSNLSEAIERIKELQDSLILNFAEEKELSEAIDTVLEELNNSISKDKIENKINEFIEKPLLDIAETEKFKFEYTLDGLYVIKYGVIHVLNEILNKE